MNQNLTTEAMMAINCTFEPHRKAMIRAGRERRRNIESAGHSLYILERIHTDNIIHRSITTVIAVSENKENLITFFHEHYRADIDFDESGHTKTIDTDMGESTFQIKEVAFIQ